MKRILRISLKSNIFRNKIPAICAILMFYRRALSVFLSFTTGISGSTGMLLICGLSVVVFLSWFFTNRRAKIRPYAYTMLVLMLIFYQISIHFAPNYLVLDYFREFLLYCVTGAVIISFVDDYEAYIKVFCVISFFIFVFCAPLPFVSGGFTYHNMGILGSGMVYGEWIMCPCFYGFFFLRNRYNKKWASVLELIDLVLVGVFANRSSLLSILVFILLYHITILKIMNRNKLILLITLGVLGCVALLFMEEILIFITNSLSTIGINSRALIKYIAMFSEEVDSSYILSGRDRINEIALEYIKQYPLFGIGIGSFPVLTGIVYTHNIVTDALSCFGLIGGSIVLYYTGKAVYYAFVGNYGALKSMMLLLFILVFPRLLFSKTFVNDLSFWMFIVFALGHGNRSHKKSRIQSTESVPYMAAAPAE